MSLRSFLLIAWLLAPCHYVAAQSVGATPVGARSAAVKLHQGRPTLFVDGQPTAPMFYALTHAYGGRWSWEEVPARNIANFARAGIRLFQADIYLEDIWYKDRDTLDIAKVQRQVRGFVDATPDAAVVLRVHVNAPFWWNEANRDECTEYADGPVQDSLRAGPPFHNEEYDIDRPLRASLASERWRLAAGTRLAELCRKLARTPEGNAVMGMHVAGGIYGEWHYWGFIEHDPDTGPAMTRYFRNWLRQTYKTEKALRSAWRDPLATFGEASVPGVAERLRTDDGVFKDPARNQRVIDYFTAQQQVVADNIVHFCRIVKETWPRPLITGVFYGYLHMTFNRQTVGGHLFIEPILNSPYVDYLAAPQTYWEASRRLGGSGNSRGVIESTLLHGKLWLDEIDNGYLHPSNSYDVIRHRPRYDADYEAVLHRTTWLPLLRGIGFWLYDFGLAKGFGWWDNPKYLEAIRRQKQLADERLNVPYRSEADVLYVWSMDAFYYLKPAWSPVSMNVLDHSVEQALRSGTVGDHVFDFDLKRVNLNPYKAVVFMNAYKLTEAQRQFIRNRVAQQGRTLVWNYLTGFTDGQKLDLDYVAELSSLKLRRHEPAGPQEVTFAQPNYTYKFDGVVAPAVVIDDNRAVPLARLPTGDVVIARRKFKEYTSVLCAVPLNGTDGFRQIFREAGCHVYNEQNDFTYAGSGLLLLHTATGGPRTIRLRSGARLTLDLPRATTLLLDTNTGRTLWP